RRTCPHWTSCETAAWETMKTTMTGTARRWLQPLPATLWVGTKVCSTWTPFQSFLSFFRGVSPPTT
ncbi:unnamed protein product, partial [Ectocarpus sp. 8 AP-2014]